MATIPLCRFYQGNNWERLSDNILLDEFQAWYCKSFNIDVENFSMTQEFSERVEGLIFKENRTHEDIDEITNELAIKYDLSYGMSLPGISELHDTIMAPNTPLSHVSIPHRITEYAEQLTRRGAPVRNSWNVLGDRSVSVVTTADNGPIAVWDWHAGTRARKFLNGVIQRMDSQMTVEAEENAMKLLKTKITKSQYRCYVLNDCFHERSEKSDIHYFFRKGKPVVAVSFHGKHADGGKILACLCLHPYGYYRGSHAGLMTPTDEVIAQLLLMRADERKFWAKSGQWKSYDTRSGL